MTMHVLTEVFFFTDALPKWPRILLEVASLDSWDRHRVEGYAYLDLPSIPGKLSIQLYRVAHWWVVNTGSYEMNIATWKPAGRRLLDRMRRFFVGGPPEVDDITYVACPRDFNV